MKPNPFFKWCVALPSIALFVCCPIGLIGVYAWLFDGSKFGGHVENFAKKCSEAFNL